MTCFSLCPAVVPQQAKLLKYWHILDKLILYIDVIHECALWVNGLWLAWPPDLPNDLESSVTCVSIRSTECQVRITILWSPCHMSKSISLRLLVDSFPENLCSSPFIIVFLQKSNCMEVRDKLMTESKVTAPPAGRAETAWLAKRVNMSSVRKGNFKHKAQKLSTIIWSKAYHVHLLHVQCPCFFWISNEFQRNGFPKSLRVKQVTIWNFRSSRYSGKRSDTARAAAAHISIWTLTWRIWRLWLGPAIILEANGFKWLDHQFNIEYDSWPVLPFVGNR